MSSPTPPKQGMDPVSRFLAKCILWIGGGLLAMATCAIVSDQVLTMQQPRRVLIPTSTPRPIPTATEPLIESIPYYIMMQYTEDYLGDYVRIQGKVVDAVKKQEDYLLLVDMENRMEDGTHTIMVLCSACDQPSIGTRTRFVGILMGRDIHDGITMPFLWMTHYQ